MGTFDDLAEQLAQGASAEERIAAAEALARLSDPRVAPTLARALSDPDERVQARVQELLGEFCHRDGTGHLRALLDEAERVAGALAAEVHRLRGGEPPEAPAPPVQPIEPPAGYDGPCALVLLVPLPPAQREVKRVGSIVARGLGTALYQVTREISMSKGFLARDVPAPLARALVRELHESHVLVGAVPMDRVPTSPALVRMREPTFSREALRGFAVPGGAACEVAWESIELAVAGRVDVELRREARDEDWSLFTRPIASGQGRAHEAAHEYLVEIFVGEPVRRYRLGTHELDFAVMQRRPSSFARVARLARALVPHLRRSRMNAGLRRLEETNQDDWDDLTFASHVGFEKYVAWQRLLMALGVPLPR